MDRDAEAMGRFGQGRGADLVHDPRVTDGVRSQKDHVAVGDERGRSGIHGVDHGDPRLGEALCQQLALVERTALQADDPDVPGCRPME